MMPAKYSGRGAVSPKISWTGAPPTTQAFAIIFHDMDPALNGGTEDVLHWMFGTSRDVNGSSRGVSGRRSSGWPRQGRGITGQNAYFGPARRLREHITMCSKCMR